MPQLNAAVSPALDSLGDAEHEGATFKLFCQLMSGAITALVPLVWLTGGNQQEILVTVLLSAVSWLCLLLVVWGKADHVPKLMVGSVLGVACLAVMASGSVRSAVTVLFLGGVVSTGIFLNRNALIGAVVFSLLALGALTWSETTGLISPNMSVVGVRDWIVHALSIVLLGYMVFFSRTRAKHAMRQRLLEFERRKAIELELARSTERFERIFRANPNPMVAQSARDGQILDINPAFERCFGYSRDEVLGQDDAFLWADPDLRETHRQTMLNERRSDLPLVRFLRRDGTGFDAILSSEMGEDPDDPLIIISAVDISAQVAVEQRLRASEERFAKAFNFSPLDMKITRVSDGSLVRVRQASHIPGQPFEMRSMGRQPLKWVRAEDRAVFLKALCHQGFLHGHEASMLREDGSPTEVRIWAELIDVEGEACILSCNLNVSEEKRRNALLKDIAAGISSQTGEAFFVALAHHMARALDADLVMVSELEGDSVRTLAGSRDGASMPSFEYPLAGTPCGAAIQQTGPFACAQELQLRFPECLPLADGEFVAYAGQSLRAPDGTPVGVLSAFWRRSRVLDAESQALMAIFSSRTNAELARLRQEREVRRLNASLEHRVRLRTAELEQVNAELDAFAYSVSHDLKSPLRSIDGFTQILQERLDGRTDAEERALMGRVLGATSRMSKLIADMLSLARISQCQMNLSLVDLTAMAWDILAQAPLNTQERRIGWRISDDLICVCDASLARIALENLLNNALKYTRDEPCPVIEFAREASGASFFIRDNGAGFDMAHADKLFKPFQRLHMPSAFEGAGIGLATVRRIVERHGGEVKGEGAVGGGAVFHFRFGPARAANA